MLENLVVQMEKRTLTKVRRRFVQKKEEDEQHTIVSPTILYINDNNVCILSPSMSLVEINRKLYSGPQYLNSHFNITSSFIQNHTFSKAVTLALSLNQNSQAIPWEYTMKRLESFGDLELATWAHRVINYTKYYKQLIDKCMRLHSCDDIYEDRSRHEKLAQISRDIENRCSYYKVVHCYGPDSAEVKEMSYSESFLQEMGYSIESFLKWTSRNGLPPVFDHKCSIYLQTLKAIFEGSMLSLSSVNIGEPFITVLIDTNGLKKNVVVESVYLVEPSPDGLLGTAYFILKENNDNMYYPEDTPSILQQKKIRSEQDMEVEKCPIKKLFHF